MTGDGWMGDGWGAFDLFIVVFCLPRLQLSFSLLAFLRIYIHTYSIFFSASLEFLLLLLLLIARGGKVGGMDERSRRGTLSQLLEIYVWVPTFVDFVPVLQIWLKVGI